jgi:hypothetical protein
MPTYRLEEYDPRVEVRRRVASEYAKRARYNQFFVMLATDGLYVSGLTDNNVMTYSSNEENALIFGTYAEAEAYAQTLRDRFQMSRDVIITVHDPRLDVISEEG